MTNRRRTARGAAMVLAGGLLAGCDGALVVLNDEPDAPWDLEGWYYAHAVDLAWRMGSGWRGESFLVYGKREDDGDYFFLAEVTSCIEDECVYRDINVVPGTTYEYYVSAYDPDTGLETPTERAVAVWVPHPVPPPVPERLAAIGLDGAVYLHWDDAPALEDDFLAYRVYANAGDGREWIGETDSPGFMDLLAANGRSATYHVTSVDDQGHESDFSEEAEGTPRVDYAGEVIYAHQDRPDASGFRFRESDDVAAIVSGDAEERHFRVEGGADALWIVPGSRARVHREAVWTTALKCGPGADADCVSWETAPLSGYSSDPVALAPGYTYMLRVPGDDGEVHFGAVRPSIAGFDQDGDELVVFDWAYQPLAGNPSLDRAGR